MSWISENVLENPMMAEVGRFRQMQRAKSLSAAGTRALLLLSILTAGFLCWIITFTDGSVEPFATFYVQLVFCLIAIPLKFYGCIAGEREKRSWELLRVAPVTNLQLAIGKFASMAYMVLVIHAIFLLPLLISAATYGSRWDYTYYGYHPNQEFGVSFGRLAAGELYSILLSLFGAALTLFFSARSKRSYTALALTLGTMAILFIFGPLFLSILISELPAMNFMNPMYSMYYLGAGRMPREEAYGDILNFGIASSIGTTALLVFVFVVYTAKTLHFADNLVKFIPKRQADA